MALVFGAVVCGSNALLLAIEGGSGTRAGAAFIFAMIFVTIALADPRQGEPALPMLNGKVRRFAIWVVGICLLIAVIKAANPGALKWETADDAAASAAEAAASDAATAATDAAAFHEGANVDATSTPGHVSLAPESADMGPADEQPVRRPKGLSVDQIMHGTSNEAEIETATREAVSEE